ncbi:transcriptional regulator [Paraglaciecola hydrolytica]|uniref:Transcriptional regulator n=1 Tax=Paraglaciecola hydrolytica TaxID=1799789 RepID=A0A136A6A6_9ALTE|nr:transcriptional regulator [Paraglaciecola hydrolytica]
MSLKSLEAFNAIIKTGSATAAAKQLGLTQPGISRLLALLEEYIGFQLFYREKGRLIPTDEALTLVKEVELTLMSVDRIALLANNIFHSNLGQLRLVAPNSFIAGPLADVVTDFLQKHPRVKISLDTHSPTRAREIVVHRSADCGFIQLPENHPGLICHHLVSSNTVCAVSSTHKLATKKVLSCKDLGDEDLILLGKGRNSRLQIENAFLRDKIPMQVRLETHTVAIACTFAKRNIGIAIVNEMLAQQYASEGLVLIPFTPQIVHEYAFITSAHAPMNRLTEAFYQHCKTYFENKF